MDQHCQHHHGDAETHRQKGEYGVRGDRFLGGEVAGTPHHGHREQGEIDAAHGPQLGFSRDISQSNDSYLSM
jgi:hypothetical protein